VISMGQAKRRGSFEQRKAEAEYHASEKQRYQKWLKEHRPRVSFMNSHGERSSYWSSVRLSALVAWAESTGRDVVISN